MVAPDRLSTDQSLVREESSSNTGSSNNSSPAARRKKTDFKVIGEVGVQLLLPTVVLTSAGRMPHTDGSKMLSRVLNNSPAGCGNLSQFLFTLLNLVK